MIDDRSGFRVGRTTYPPAIALAGFALIALGQTRVTKPEFDAATLKPVEPGKRVPGGMRPRGGPGTSDPGRVTVGRDTLHGLLMRAFDIAPGSGRLVTPGWMSDITRAFSLEATMPPTTTLRDYHLMLQNLLIERFKIQLHHETKSFRSYDLVVAPGGPRLKKSADAEGLEAVIDRVPAMDSEGYPILPAGHGMARVRREGGTYAAFRNYSIAELIQVVLAPEVSSERGVATPVEDKTGLTGRYDFRLRFASEAGVVAVPGRRAVPEADGVSSLPTIIKAVEQLGLRLVAGKPSQLDVIVIDRAEKTPIRE